MQRAPIIKSLLFVALPYACGQTGPTLVDLSYTVPPSLTVAPGQIANQTPLPTTLAGISAGR